MRLVCFLMTFKTIRISVDVYIKLRQRMLNDLKKGTDPKTISNFLEGLLDDSDKL